MRLRIVSPERFCTVVAILVMIAFLLGFACSGNSYEVEEISIHEGDTLWTIADEYTGNDRDVRETVHIIKKINDMDSVIVYPGEVIYVPIYVK